MSLADRRTKQMKTLLTRMFKADSLFQVRSAKLRMRVSLTRHPHYLRAWNSLKGRELEGPVVQKKLRDNALSSVHVNPLLSPPFSEEES